MPRIQHRHPTRPGHGLSALDRTRAARKKKPYKVVMEVVTQEKKKLRTVMAYTSNAPQGYTFVPLGNRDLTDYCKERCRSRNLTAYNVSAKKFLRKLERTGSGRRKNKVDPEKDSGNDRAGPDRIDTHRVGHHFPSQVVAQACDMLGYTVRSNGLFHKARRDYEGTQLARSLHHHGQQMQLEGRPATEQQTREQVRNAILECFPKIPEADLEGCLSHAFEKGTDRVGNAKDLTLARRVQLAVGAYVRHQHTNYDKMLESQVPWVEARHRAQPTSHAKLNEWRDEAEGHSNELEETFREIIILDDDDDDDGSSVDRETSEDSLMDADDRGRHLEVVSSQATARELQPDMAWESRADAHRARQNFPRVVVPAPSHYDSSSMAGASAYPARRVYAQPQPRVASNAPLQPSRSYVVDQYGISYRRPNEQYVQRAMGNSGPAYDYSQPRFTASEPTARHSQIPTLIHQEDGRRQLFHRTPIYDPRPPPSPVDYFPSSRPVPHQRRDVQVSYQRPPHDYYVDRDRPAPIPVSRRTSPGGEVVYQSIEREAEPLPYLSRIDDTRYALQHNHSSLPSGPFSMTAQPEMRPPREFALPAPVHSRAYGDRDQMPRTMRPTHADVVLARSFQAFQPYLAQRQPRVQPVREPEIIDLVSSPHRPSGSDRYGVPSHSHTTAGATRPSYIPEASREYSTRMNGYVPADGPLATYEEYREAQRRPRLADEGRYTRSGLQYH